MRLGVLGAGSWGTALGVHLARHKRRVLLWGRRPDLAEEMQRTRRNPVYLPGVELPEELRVTADLDELTACDAILVVVPSHGFRQVVRDFLRRLPADSDPKVLVSATKGIETDSLAQMSEVTFEEAVAADREVRFAVLSGPTFAVELAAEAPTAAVVASAEDDVARRVQHALSDRVLRLYSSTDVAGVELGGTSKNVIAIAAGLVSGLALGHNTLAALLTRGLHEITRLGIACGGKPRTFAGLAGMGDLVLTCTCELSRNLRLGLRLAAGAALEEVSSSTPMVAEGVRASLAVARIAERRGVEMPITEQMVKVLYQGKPPRQVVEELMQRGLRSESEL
jgi:glycerol-3-phosphate dehydrogenase (NAD(P)+)